MYFCELFTQILHANGITWIFFFLIQQMEIPCIFIVCPWKICCYLLSVYICYHHMVYRLEEQYSIAASRLCWVHAILIFFIFILSVKNLSSQKYKLFIGHDLLPGTRFVFVTKKIWAKFFVFICKWFKTSLSWKREQMEKWHFFEKS